MKKKVKIFLICLHAAAFVAGIAVLAAYLRNATLESRTLTFTLMGLESSSLDSAAHYYRLAVDVPKNRETSRAREHLIRTYWYLSKTGSDEYQQRVYLQLAREEYREIEASDAPRGRVQVLYELVFADNDSLFYDPASDRIIREQAAP